MYEHSFIIQDTNFYFILSTDSNGNTSHLFNTKNMDREKIKERNKQYRQTDNYKITQIKYRQSEKYKKIVSKRRSLGFKPINSKFKESEAHHINKEDVIFIPKQLHKSIYHDNNTGKNMEKINKEAFNWLCIQEVL